MQALFAARTVADIVGRLIPRTDCISTRWGMVGAGLVKTAITPLFFVYLAAGVAWRSDVLAIAYIFAFWLMSGCASLPTPSTSCQEMLDWLDSPVNDDNESHQGFYDQEVVGKQTLLAVAHHYSQSFICQAGQPCLHRPFQLSARFPVLPTSAGSGH